MAFDPNKGLEPVGAFCYPEREVKGGLSCHRFCLTWSATVCSVFSR